MNPCCRYFEYYVATNFIKYVNILHAWHALFRFIYRESYGKNTSYTIFSAISENIHRYMYLFGKYQVYWYLPDLREQWIYEWVLPYALLYWFNFIYCRCHFHMFGYVISYHKKVPKPYITTNTCKYKLIYCWYAFLYIIYLLGIVQTQYIL